MIGPAVGNSIECSAMRLRFAVATLLLTSWAGAQAPGAVFIVRHAEKATTAKDTPLSAEGRKRAECLAMTMRDGDVRTVIVSEFKRTQQTAAPFVTSSKLTLTVIAAGDTQKIVDTVTAAAKSGGNVLVVAHSNTMPDIIKSLGVTPPAVGDHEYDRLFIVRVGPAPSLIKLRYCPAAPHQERGR
jgi:phosphohistidine phosphatase SixA